MQPDAAKLTPAELDGAIDRTLELLVICVKISNRGGNLNSNFPDFKAFAGFSVSAGVTPFGVLHWPVFDPSSERAKASDKLRERLSAINAADSSESAPSTQETPAQP